MSFKSWRERQRHSQERIAEMSGLSLRTVQRLEAGHRVSYASLRALAVTFQVDVDTLERELYAVNKTSDDYVEMPRWARVLNDTRWFGGPHPSRRDVLLIEAFCIGCAVVLFVASFLVVSAATAKAFRQCGAVELACGYAVSVFIRLGDSYPLWRETGAAASGSLRRAPRWRSAVVGYAYALGLAALFVLAFQWLVL